MIVGIDLGTTFCCVAYINDKGELEIIPNSEGQYTTPSVVYFDGKIAIVGEKANELKHKNKNKFPHPIFERVKRDIGKPIEIPPELFKVQETLPEPAPYEVGGFKYGAHGISAIILRKLKRDAINYFKKIGKLDKSIDEKDYELPAVITVPAYYGDEQRREVRIAGYAAGLNVIGIINEPTAAALAYGLNFSENNKKIMVFDLGGGTLDITILHIKNQDEIEVVASEGNNQLGGVDWDKLIEEYIIDQFQRKFNTPIPLDMGFEIQKLALKAKFELTEKEETTITLDVEDIGELQLTLYRNRKDNRFSIDTEEDSFYFEERSLDLLTRCKVTVETLLANNKLSWDDIDEIILAGGACRMPMIPKLLEEISGKKIRTNVKGFSYDTAIAIGAALYGHYKTYLKGKSKKKITDALSHSIGVEYVEAGSHFIDHLLKKNQPLPCYAERRFKAGPNAVVKIYEGESRRPEECTLRGEIKLDNFQGYVDVKMSVDEEGMIKIIAEYDGKQKELEISHKLYEFSEREKILREKIQAIKIKDKI
jgi:molecular chaperone DnaK